MNTQQAAVRRSVLKPATTEIGLRIDALCERDGLSFRDLARLLGVPREAISQARRGGKPRATWGLLETRLEGYETRKERMRWLE